MSILLHHAYFVGGPEAPSEKKMYGFGAAADVVMYIPFLRNVMGWLSGGPASYKALKDGLTKVIIIINCSI